MRLSRVERGENEVGAQQSLLHVLHPEERAPRQDGDRSLRRRLDRPDERSDPGAERRIAGAREAEDAARLVRRELLAQPGEDLPDRGILLLLPFGQS